MKYQVRVSAENEEVGGTTKNLASQLRADFQFEKGSTPAPTYDVTKMTNDGGTHLSASSIFASDWSDEVQATTNPADSTKAATVPVGIWLPTGVPGDYAGAACTLRIAVYAVQANARVTNPTAGAFTIYNPADLYRFANEVNGGNTFDDQTVELGSDIFLSEPAAHRMAKRSAYALADAIPYASTAEGPWEPIGSTGTAFKGTFDGHGYTIYGLKATGNGASTGLFGVVEDATIKDVILSNVTVSATGEGSVAGIVAAEARGSTTLSGVTVKNSTVTGETMTGGLIGKTAESSNLTVKDSSSELVSEGGDTLETEWAEDNEGAIPKSSIFEIPSAEGLRAFADMVNGGSSFAGITVVLTSDVDLVGENWTPAGTSANPFTGTFMGGTIGQDGTVTPTTRTISNMKMNFSAKGDEFYGFFGRIGENTVIDHLIFTHVDLNASASVKFGILVGQVQGTAAISNITVADGIVNTQKAAGGIISYIAAGEGKEVTVSHCENNASLTVGQKVGGIVAHAGTTGTVTISDCVNNGVLVSLGCAGDETNAGGIIGYLMSKGTVTIEHCKNTGSITATQPETGSKLNVGGIICTAHDGKFTIKDVENYGTVKAIDQAITNGAAMKLGGIIGSTSQQVTLTNATSKGDVIGISARGEAHVGALMGFHDAYAVLTVDGSTLVECKLEGLIPENSEVVNKATVGAVTGYYTKNGGLTVKGAHITVNANPQGSIFYGIIGGTDIANPAVNISDTTLKLTSDEYTSTVNWDGEGNVTVPTSEDTKS